QWYVAAKELNRPQVYLDSISFVANEFKQGKVLPTEAISAMQADISTHTQQLIAVKQLNQLSERDFVQLHRSVSDYFKETPTPPPPEADKQLVRDELKLLTTKVESLLKTQLSQVEQVNLLQNKRFGTWSLPYKEAVALLEQTQDSLLRFNARIDQHEAQLQHWKTQSKDYQAWQNDPRTHQMKELYEVLNSPQMQARLKSIQQQEQQQPTVRSHKYKSSAVSI
ncbi:MAG TPA: hypothetical protein DEV81_00905, partial [Cyanobacteria bacterium UBA11049]|nr:hypothetical protein [Cyanobacteria bacterium UBA11049]